MNKTVQYEQVMQQLRALIEGEMDEIALEATIACELHHGLDYFDWTGFYRVTAPGVLKVGPYQGGHGCLTIPFEKGVCGKCAREGRMQLVRDVAQLPYHIACSSSTRAEIVVPIFDPAGQVRAVLDVDSNTPAAFDDTDARCLEEICRWLEPVFKPLGPITAYGLPAEPEYTWKQAEVNLNLADGKPSESHHHP